jgi:hypothetical protein
MAEQQRAFKGVWIPADIWLNENLSLQEKAVLAEIDSFCSRYESCYASNEHFARFIGVSTRRIRDILKSLEDKHLIEREVIYKKGTKEIEKRFLRLPYPYGRKLPQGAEENFPTPTEENCPDNIPSFNKSKNSKVNIYSLAENCSDSFKEAWQGFVDMRKAKKKPMTERAAKMILKKLDKLSGGDEEMQIAILDKSVVKCWDDVYELKEQYIPSRYKKESSQEKADRLLAEVMADTEG